MDKKEWIEFKKELEGYPLELRLKYLKELIGKKENKEITNEIKKEIEKIEILIQEQRFFKRDSGEFLIQRRGIEEEQEIMPEKKLENRFGFVSNGEEIKEEKVKYNLEPIKMGQIKYHTPSVEELRAVTSNLTKTYNELKGMSYQNEPLTRTELETLEQARDDLRKFEGMSMSPEAKEIFLKDKTLLENVIKYKPKKEEY